MTIDFNVSIRPTDPSRETLLESQRLEDASIVVRLLTADCKRIVCSSRKENGLRSRFRTNPCADERHFGFSARPNRARP